MNSHDKRFADAQVEQNIPFMQRGYNRLFYHDADRVIKFI